MSVSQDGNEKNKQNIESWQNAVFYANLERPWMTTAVNKHF